MAAIKIARIITRLNVGGPAYQTLMLANSMPEKFQTLLIAGQVDVGEQQFDTLIDRYPCNLRFCKHLQRRISPIKDLLALAWLVWQATLLGASKIGESAGGRSVSLFRLVNTTFAPSATISLVVLSPMPSVPPVKNCYFAV